MKSNLRKQRRGVPHPDGDGLVSTVNQGRQIRYDTDDRELIEAHTWTAQQKSEGYWCAMTWIGSKRYYLHHLLGYRNGDHVNGDALDNRRVNMRHATRSQQTANQPKRRSMKGTPVTSEYKGVARTPHGRWAVQAGPAFLGSKRYIGTYQSERAAAAAYNQRINELRNSKDSRLREWAERARLNELPKVRLIPSTQLTNGV